jgi:heat shock protein HslJ
MNTIIKTLLATLLAALILAACSTVQSVDLTDTKWTLTSLQMDGISLDLAAPNPVTLEIAEDQAVSGSAGCNSYFGTIDFKPDGSLKISNIGSTEMYCMEGMEVETAFLGVLRDAESWSLDGDSLTINAASGKSVLVFSQ